MNIKFICHNYTYNNYYKMDSGSERDWVVDECNNIYNHLLEYQETILLHSLDRHRFLIIVTVRKVHN